MFFVLISFDFVFLVSQISKCEQVIVRYVGGFIDFGGVMCENGNRDDGFVLGFVCVDE